jgi:hypothetical protein
MNYCIHKDPLLDTILSQLSPVHTLTPYLFKINFNIILHLRQSLSAYLSLRVFD